MVKTVFCLLSSLLVISIQFGGSRSVSALKNITELPGFDGPLPFSLETGYVDVDEEKGVELFYYFVESENSPEQDPLILWLTGGPGCSGFQALVFEIGPINYDVAGYVNGLPSLVYNPYTWTKVSNILFLDSPAGAGFSYSRTQESYITNDTHTVHNILIFLSKWLDEHPKLKTNPLYIGGDSYSGVIVPAVALEIALGNLPNDGAPLDFMGYLVGNPYTESSYANWRIPFAHMMQLISNELYLSLMKNCQGDFSNPRDARCASDLKDYKECTKDVNEQNILEPLCPGTGHRELRRKMIEELSWLNPDFPFHCTIDGYPLSEIWANNETVREAFGVRKGTRQTWKRCDHSIPYTYDIVSAIPYHKNITSLNKGYQALVYSGDHDMVIPTISKLDWIKSLNFSISDEWRPWYVDGQVAGYTRAYTNNFTFATIKNAGHTAPEYKRKESQAMFERWLSSVPV